MLKHTAAVLTLLPIALASACNTDVPPLEPSDPEEDESSEVTGEGEGEESVEDEEEEDSCPLSTSFRALADGELNDPAGSWTLENAEPIVFELNGDRGVHFSGPAMCDGTASISQLVEIPKPCNGFAPAVFLESSIVTSGFASSHVTVRIDGIDVAAGCLSDRWFGREVLFEVFGHVTTGDGEVCSGGLTADVWNVNITGADCPAPGVQPLSEWRTFPTSDATGTADDTGLTLTLAGPCDHVMVTGTASVPSFAGAALSIDGTFEAQHGAVLEVLVDGVVAASRSDLADDTIVCLPRGRAGAVVDLQVTLTGPYGLCAPSTPESAHITGIDIVDVDACAARGAVPDPHFDDPSSWSLVGDAVIASGALTLHAPSVCESGAASSSLTVPTGNHHALAIAYTLIGDDVDASIELAAIPVGHFTTSQQELRVCLDPRTATALQPLRIAMVMPQTQPGCDEPVAPNELVVTSVDVVDDVTCD